MSIPFDNSLFADIADTLGLGNPAIKSLGKLIAQTISLDVKRFGNQHPQLVNSPFDELKFELNLLSEKPNFRERYNKYVTPMVYNINPVTWDEALRVFTKLASEVLAYISKEDD